MSGASSVHVDRDFVRIGSKSYAIRQINTVDVQWKYAYKRAWAAWWLLCLLCLPVGGTALPGKGPQPDGGGVAAAFFLLAAFFALMGWRSWRRSNIREYTLIFDTSSRAIQALTSRDADLIFDVRKKVEAAIAGQIDYSVPRQ